MSKIRVNILKIEQSNFDKMQTIYFKTKRNSRKINVQTVVKNNPTI